MKALPRVMKSSPVCKSGRNSNCMAVIEMDGLRKDYIMGNGAANPILKSIDLVVEAGEFISIMGPSGSGKSTLMNILGTLDRSTSGVYHLDGENIALYNSVELARLRNNTIGFVFQGFNLLPRRTVLDNIALPLFYGGDSRKERMRRAQYYLERMGLSKYAAFFPTQLSGGQQQRIAIARGFVGEPKLILADEPTGASRQSYQQGNHGYF